MALEDQLVKHVERLTHEFTKAWAASDLAEALNKLHQLSELTRGLLVINQLVQGR
jgi:hypothetical protein